MAFDPYSDTHTPSEKTESLGAIAQLRSYWHGLYDGATPPARSMIDPRALSGALEQCFLIERIAPGIARFRIIGQLFNQLTAMDIRGMPMSCLFAPISRDRLQYDLERVFRSPAIVTLELMAERSLGRGALSGRLQILPLTGAEGACNMAIGCLEVTGDTRGPIGASFGQGPRRFSITGAVIDHLPQPSAAPHQPATRASASASAKIITLYATAALPQPAAFCPPRAQPGVPHLRLVKG